MDDDIRVARPFQASRIEDEPILGAVLMLPDGGIRPLSWFERLLVALRLADAKSLELRHWRPAGS